MPLSALTARLLKILNGGPGVPGGPWASLTKDVQLGDRLNEIVTALSLATGATAGVIANTILIAANTVAIGNNTTGLAAAILTIGRLFPGVELFNFGNSPTGAPLTVASTTRLMILDSAAGGVRVLIPASVASPGQQREILYLVIDNSNTIEFAPVVGGNDISGTVGGAPGPGNPYGANTGTQPALGLLKDIGDGSWWVSASPDDAYQQAQNAAGAVTNLADIHRTSFILHEEFHAHGATEAEGAPPWVPFTGIDAAAVAPTHDATQVGGVWQLTSGAGDGADANDAVQLVWQGVPLQLDSMSGSEVRFQARVRLNTTIVNAKVFVGLTDNAATLEVPFVNPADVPADIAADALGFLFSEDATTKDWWLLAVEQARYELSQP